MSTFLLFRKPFEPDPSKTQEIRLSDRQVDLSNRILGLWSWEIIGKEVRDAMLDRLWENLDSLDVEITKWEKLRVR